jgi:hypothetical protein
LVFLALFAVIGTNQAQAANDKGFGAATYDTDVGFELNISDDMQAFTATFAGLETSIDSKSSPPVASNSFSFVVPLSGLDAGAEITFSLQGTYKREAAANGHLIISVNEQAAVLNLPAKSDDTYVQQFKYKTGSSPECRVTVVLLADRETKSGASVYLNVSSIDASISAPRAPAKGTK